jgi:hypothetical protein
LDKTLYRLSDLYLHDQDDVQESAALGRADPHADVSMAAQFESFSALKIAAA